ncbi:MAG: hypothetical protein WBC19_09380 [Pyrinomonadaceae bacterium]
MRVHLTAENSKVLRSTESSRSAAFSREIIPATGVVHHAQGSVLAVRKPKQE